MKKLLILLTTGVLCLTSLTACGKPQLDDWGSNVTYWEDVTPEDNWWGDDQEVLEEEIIEEEIIEEEIIEEEES